MTASRFRALLYLQQFIGELMPIYPLYALMLVDRGGLSTAQVSGLFFFWTAVALVSEVPTGVLADKTSRRSAIVGSYLLQGGGFLAWLVWPGLAGYATGFLLWGIGYALASGSLQAYVYEHLRRTGAGDDFTKVFARSESMKLAAMVVAYAFATLIGPGLYTVVLTVSVIFSVLAAALATCFPSPPVVERDHTGHIALLREALREVRGSRRIAGHVLALGVVLGVAGTMMEYIPLFYRHIGYSTAVIPALLMLGLALSTVVGWYLHVLAGLRFSTLAIVVAAAGGILLIGTLTPRLPALFAMMLFMRCILAAQTLYYAALQHTVTDERRATIGSVASFVGEIVALGLLAVFGVVAALAGDNAAYQAVAALFVVAGLGLFAMGRRPALRDAHLTAPGVVASPGHPVREPGPELG